MFKAFIIFALLFIAVFAHSQQKEDTTTIINAWNISRQTKNPVPAGIDTSMKAVHVYNPVFENSFSNTWLGNTGQAYMNNKFYERDKQYPFLFAFPYQVYIYDPYKIQHYNTRKPYTQLEYLTFGSRDNSEQVLTAKHTQNINPKTNIGILYDLIASRGIYLNQNLSSNRLSLFGSYQEKNYHVFASAHSNSIKAQENGGLFSLEEFFEHELDEINYRVYLDDASSHLKNYSVFVTQKYIPGLRDKKVKETDTVTTIADTLLTQDSLIIENDTIPPAPADTLQDLIPPAKIKATENFAFQHTLQYSRFIRNYGDDINRNDTLSFYRNFYYAGNQSHDSAFYQELENRLDISFIFARGSQELRAWAKHQFRSYSYDYPWPVSLSVSPVYDTVVTRSHKDIYNDIAVGGSFRGVLGNWEYETNGEVYLTGYRQSDIKAEGRFIRYLSQKQRMISLSGLISSVRPDYFLMNYRSSHFKWNNNFNNIDNIKLRFDYKGKNDLKAVVVLNYLTGYVFFNELAMPEQFKDQMIIPSVFLEKTFKWGPVRQEHKILWQKPSSNVVHLPDLAYGNSTWYQNEVFNEVLKFQIGLKLYYYTNYYLDAYMPATGMFYRQTDRKYGNYPFVDAFLNWSLKRTRFTLQYTNALAGIAGYNYFMAHRHPTFNSALRFGLSWTFYD